MALPPLQTAYSQQPPPKPALTATGTAAPPPPKPALTATGVVPTTNYSLGGGGTTAGQVTNTGTATAAVPTLTLGAGGKLGTAQPAALPQSPVAPTPLPQSPVVDNVSPGIGTTYGSTAPDVTGGVPPAAGSADAPNFSTQNPLGENPMMGASSGGGYERNLLEKAYGKAMIAPTGAYDIGPYYGYAFDAGGRVLDTGYDTAGALANAGTAASQLGVGAGQQVGAAAQGYAGQIETAGFGAQAATQGYEDRLNQYGALAKDAAGAAQSIGTAGQTAASTAGRSLTQQGGQFIDQGAAAGQQNIADVNLKASQDALKASSGLATQLSGIGAQPGPSAAQAQLQSALNQSQQSNLAMARSGRGWGGSASAQSQALAQNAAAGQQAANSSAMLRAQEEQQRLQMLSSNVGQAAQIQQTGANTALSQQQLAAQTNLQEAAQQQQAQQQLYALGLQSQQAGADLGVQGTNLALAGNQAYQQGLGTAGQMATAGAQTDLAGRQANIAALGQAGALETQGLQAGAELGLQGISTGAELYGQGQKASTDAELQAMQFAAQQQQALQAQANAALQQYGIQKGVAVQNAQQTMQLIGAGVATAGTLAAAASDKTVKTDIKPASVDLRPQSNYQILGGAVGDTGGSGLGGGMNSAELAGELAGGGPNKALGTLGAGMQTFGQGMQQNQGLNPLLQQSLGNVGAGAVSDRRAKTDIKPVNGPLMNVAGPNAANMMELDAAGDAAVRGIQGAGKSGQLAALDNVTRDNIAGIRNAEGMSPTSAFDAAQAYSYQYKQPEKYGQGDFVGVMAQDLEKSPAGATAVSTMPNGKKAVDMNRLGMLTAAAQSQTQEQLGTLEERLARLQRRVLASNANADGTY